MASVKKRSIKRGKAAQSATPKGAAAARTRASTAGRKTTARGRGGRRSGEAILPPPPPGTTALVIVESPAKAKTIGKYLGRGYRVKATVGHVRDLPQKKLGVDVDHGFKPEYVTIAGKEKTLAELRDAAKDSREIYLATDPDREGEAIAWHVAGQIAARVGTRSDPPRALPRDDQGRRTTQRSRTRASIDERKVNAQQARRVLDRLVGYKASPVLWKTVKKGLSAGRVQTVALRLLVEREREIRAFKPVEYWTIGAELEKDGSAVHGAAPSDRRQEAGDPTDAGSDPHRRAVRATAAELRGAMNGAFATIWPTPSASSRSPISSAASAGRIRKPRSRPAPCSRKPPRSWASAPSAPCGWRRTCTRALSSAPRARSVSSPTCGPTPRACRRSPRGRRASTSADAVRRRVPGRRAAAVRRLRRRTRRTRTKRCGPPMPTRRPELVQPYLSADQFKLYQLIWQRFMASQMAPAVFDTTTVDFDLGRLSVPLDGQRDEVPRLPGGVPRRAGRGRGPDARGRAGAARDGAG